MKQDESDFVCGVSLIVLGFELDPEFASATLALECHDSWRRGQPKRVGNDTHEWSGWKCHLRLEQKSLSFERQLDWWLETLEPRKAALNELRSAGNRCLLDVFATADAALLKLPACSIQRLGALALDIEFTFWGGQIAA